MRHGIAGRKLSRTSSHRKALFANLAMNLIEHGQIKTTLPKAKDLRRVIEPLITKARENTVSARRQVAKTIQRDDILKKLFNEVAPAFAKRNGGYTRVLKTGFRKGDNAAMAVIALTEEPLAPKVKAETKSEAKKDAPKAKAAVKAAPAKMAEKPAKKEAPEATKAEKPAK